MAFEDRLDDEQGKELSKEEVESLLLSNLRSEIDALYVYNQREPSLDSTALEALDREILELTTLFDQETDGSERKNILTQIRLKKFATQLPRKNWVHAMDIAASQNGQLRPAHRDIFTVPAPGQTQ